MESTQFDIDFLAKETFALTEALRMDGSEFQSEMIDDQDFLLKAEVEEVITAKLDEVEQLPPVPIISFEQYSYFPKVIEVIPEIPIYTETEIMDDDYEEHSQFLSDAVKYPSTPGVLFRLDAGVATFCVKGISTPNIADSFNLLKEGNEEIRKELKMKEESEIDGLLFFETKTVELANAIRENLINRRFPIEEDMVCNISDPGFSWWFNESQSGFQIYFKSHGLNRAEKYLRLGPIGDSSVAIMRFKQAESLIRGFFPVNEFACTDKVFSLSTVRPNHLSYRILKDMFVNGINETSMSQFPASSLGRTLYNYFQEVAALRGFWLYLEDLLKERS